MISLPSSPDDPGEDEKDMVKGKDQAEIDLLLGKVAMLLLWRGLPGNGRQHASKEGATCSIRQLIEAVTGEDNRV